MATKYMIVLAALVTLCFGAIPFDVERFRIHQHQFSRPQQDNGDKTITQVLREDERFSSMSKLVKSSHGLKDDLDNSELKWTVFAPTNEAFDQFNMSKGMREKDILEYHITGDSVFTIADLKDAMILSSEYKTKDLKGKQILRISVKDNNVYINLMAHVEFEVQTANGNILAIDRVLTPPPSMMETVFRLPTVFSTLATGIFRTKLESELEKGKGMTLFAPDNRAWEAMENEDIFYLFSEHGKKDLKKIIEYHVVPSVEYSTRMRQQGTIKLPTLNGKREITITAQHGQGHQGQGHQGQGQNQRQRQGQRDLMPYPRRLLSFGLFEENDVDDPTGWEYEINDVAKIAFTDAPAENGVIHLIDHVLVPDNVKLPSQKFAF